MNQLEEIPTMPWCLVQSHFCQKVFLGSLRKRNLAKSTINLVLVEKNYGVLFRWDCVPDNTKALRSGRCTLIGIQQDTENHITLPGIGIDEVKIEMDSARESPVYNPEPPSPEYTPEPPSPEYNPEPPSPEYKPEPPSPEYNPEPPSPEYNPEPPSPEYNPEPPSPEYNPEPPSPEYNPEPPQSPEYEPEHYFQAPPSPLLASSTP
ncbi:hypothetical protein R1sor_013847 [Riccia sorocarpa]|uniref:Uncharacterized protein n=1 Tax=Riccia sorocarpa TaxID=122646 RepID=A0ABD3H7W5_9MARC